MKSFLAFVLSFLAFIKATESSEKAAANQNTVLCHGPKGPRGHQGPMGDRGPVGEEGAQGKPGANAVDPGTLNVIELWSTIQNSLGDVYFTNARMTSGFSVSAPIQAITVEATGLYMFYYYFLGGNIFSETYVDGSLAYAIPILQVGNDQTWFQYPMFLQAGQVITFKSPNSALPITLPTFPEAANGVFYSITIQLITPL